MVLWELTLGTAYFLGIRRTYRLGLKIQRKVIPPKYPKIRQFVQRRTRNVFDVALKVHKSIQERDLEVGRNLGNRILRWLDKMKPSAEIRPKDPLSITSKPASKPASSSSSSTSSSHYTTTNSVAKGPTKTADGESGTGRHLFTSSRSVFRRNFPSVAMMMQHTKPSGANSQYRHLSIYGPQALKANYGGFDNGGAIRKDIMLWMLQR